MSTETYQFLGDRGDLADRARALGEVPLFQALGQDYLYALARHSQQVQAQPNEVLVRQDAPGAEFMLILSGTVRVEKNGTPVASLKTGDFFGELALLDGQPRTASVVADSACTLAVLQKEVFESLLRDVPGLERRLLLVLASRLRSRIDRALA